MSANRRAAQLLAASCSALIDAVSRYMPAGSYRDFMAWAFSADNPRRQEYLQATGVTQLINMNTTLLSGLVEERDWPEVVRFAGLMNAYQVFEVISDNLAIGLASCGQPERQQLVSDFNAAMLRALAPGHRTPAVLLLAGPAQSAAMHTSGFDQSLAAAKHAGIAQDYARTQVGEAQVETFVGQLEFGLWAALIANVETCRDLLDALATTTTAPLLRQLLADRYHAVERTHQADHLSRLELAALGSQSILVGPTLSYAVGALAELVTPISHYPGVIADGTLGDVLADAALLVRLHNDIGPRLLRMTPIQQAALLRPKTDNVLSLVAASDDPAFTRLQKDLVNGEANVALWHARRAVDAAGACNALGDSLAYYAALYAQHAARLTDGIAVLDARLGDRRIGTMIERFVRFHEKLYANPHMSTTGEYAV